MLTKIEEKNIKDILLKAWVTRFFDFFHRYSNLGEILGRDLGSITIATPLKHRVENYKLLYKKISKIF